MGRRALLSRAQWSRRIKSLFICVSFDFPTAQCSNVITHPCWALAWLIGLVRFHKFHLFCVRRKIHILVYVHRFCNKVPEFLRGGGGRRNGWIRCHVPPSSVRWKHANRRAKPRHALDSVTAHAWSMRMTLDPCGGRSSLAADSSDKGSSCRIAQNS